MKQLALTVLCILIALVSCKNSSENNIVDQELQAEAELNNDVIATDDDEAALKVGISKSAIAEMVASGNMTQEQANAIFEEIDQYESDGTFSEQFNPKKFDDSLNSMLSKLEKFKDSNAFNSKNKNRLISTRKTSKSEKVRGLENLRAALGKNRTSYIEDCVAAGFGIQKEQRTSAFRYFAEEDLSKDHADVILMDLFQITPKELRLLKSFPSAEKIVTESQAVATRDFKIPSEAFETISKGQASDNFKTLVKRFDQIRIPSTYGFIKKAKVAKAAFYKLNPSWHNIDEGTGDTYLDSHNNYIFLPLGALSFADQLISHSMPFNNGNYPDGAVHAPDLTLEHFKELNPKICNLGTEGILILEFKDNAIVNVNGPDLFVFEMGAIEPTNLEISKDGQNWINVGQIKGGTAMVDIEPYVNAKETYTYVRLTDLDTYSDLPGADVDAVAAIGGAIRLNLDSAVLFSTGEHELKEGAAAILNELLVSILEIPSGTIIIEGHTDNVGSPTANKSLSERRATTVSYFLKTHLSTKYKFQEKGFGENQPVAPNDTEINKQKNRRVEILVIPSNNT